ncbi:NAC domain-containing protein 71 [Populus alba x Populus x berolinensis]|uniref:NAC domain-containing protein 71 n=1 Tax=Populus alba x Populus x berolinensis TaxID=444605 RepID=A0AAD6MG90_9ROSI|nr:NAC domain-containing protein 71 [Populus alba x Populus x berolinensis]
MQGEHDSSIEPPPGYRFCPTDVELACFHLYRKVNGLPLPNTVKDCNLYGDHEPCEIWEAFEGSESAKDSRSKRRVGRNEGTWKGDKKIIGTFTFDTITWTRKRLSYQNPNSKKNDVSHNHSAIEKSQRRDRPCALEEHHQAKRLKLDLAHKLKPSQQLVVCQRSHRRKVKITPKI